MDKKGRKWLAIMVIAAILCLCGCGSSGTAKETEAEPDLTMVETTEPAIETTVPHTSEAIVLEEWKERYLEFIDENNIVEENITFCIGNLDADDIPELIIINAKADPGETLLWIKDGEVLQKDNIGYGRVFYFEHQGLFYASRLPYGETIEVIYSFEDGILTKLHRGHVISNLMDSSVPTEYTWDNVAVSKEEYDALLNSAFALDEATEMDYSHLIDELVDTIINW